MAILPDISAILSPAGFFVQTGLPFQLYVEVEHLLGPHGDHFPPQAEAGSLNVDLVLHSRTYLACTPFASISLPSFVST